MEIRWPPCIVVEISKDSRPHYHKKTTEIYYVLEGEGHLEIDKDKVPLKPGVSVLIPPQPAPGRGGTQNSQCSGSCVRSGGRMVCRLKFALQAHPEELVQNLGGQEVQDSSQGDPGQHGNGKRNAFSHHPRHDQKHRKRWQYVPKSSFEWSAIFFVIAWGSLISQYIHIIPKTEIKGSDAIRGFPTMATFWKLLI